MYCSSYTFKFPNCFNVFLNKTIRVCCVLALGSNAVQFRLAAAISVVLLYNVQLCHVLHLLVSMCIEWLLSKRSECARFPIIPGISCTGINIILA
jgi:hypothetical protein